MAETRYALLIGNSASFYGQPAQDIPRETLSSSLDLIRQTITSLEDYSFGWPAGESGSSSGPEVLRAKGWIQFLEALEQVEQHVDDDTLFLLYYFGHGVVHQGELHLAFGNSKTGNAKKRALSEMVQELYRVGVRKLIVIADNCHAAHGTGTIRVQRDDLRYCVLAASQGGYAFYEERGGQWTLALSEVLERWNRTSIIDRGLGYGTFAKWFERAKGVAQDERRYSRRLSPHSLDGGLADHVLFREEHRIPPYVLGSRTDRTIYNRLYLLLRMLSTQPQSADELQSSMRNERRRVFLLEEANDRYLSRDAIVRYLVHATEWDLVAVTSGVPRQYRLSQAGQAALANNGGRYNEMLRNSIYGFLGTYGVDRNFILDTMREIIRSYDVPDVRALLRAIQYTVGAMNLDRPTLEFALRMLSQSGDLRKNSGDVFFPM